MFQQVQNSSYGMMNNLSNTSDINERLSLPAKQKKQWKSLYLMNKTKTNS